MARSGMTPVRGWIIAPLVAAAALLVPVPAWVVDEFYSRDLYPWLQNGLTFASNQVPLAVFDLLVGLVGVLVLYRLVRLTMRVVSRGPLSTAWEGARRVVRAAAVVVLLFLVAWGCNYRRLPLERALGTGPVTPSPQLLQQAIADANALAGRLRASGRIDSDPTMAAVAEQLRIPMNTALEELGRAPLSRPGLPKVSWLLSPFFTWAGVNGMINPFALESIVHPDLVPVERAVVLAHEWAHLAGQADEAEASAVGWLACIRGNPTLAYSASVGLIMDAIGGLPSGEQRRVYGRLEPGVRADIARVAERLRQQKPQVQQAATRVYDEYLKANRVADGTASYDRALTLILSPGFQEALRGYTF
jgi:hypothetical protein